MKKQLINLEPVREQVKQKLLEKYDTSTFMNTTKVELKVDVADILDEFIEQQNIIEPTVCITTKAYIKMRLLVDKFDKEIGWYGIVNQMPGLDNTYVIEDIVVYPQTVSGATCEQDEDRMFEFEMRLTTDQVNHKRFHGHSHVNMATGPSGVDENFYQELLSQVTDFFIITVTNKRNEYTTRFYDVANNILYTDVEIHLIDDNGNMMSNWYDEQIENNISKPTPIVANTSVTKLDPYNGRTLFDNDYRKYDPYEYMEYEDMYGDTSWWDKLYHKEKENDKRGSKRKKGRM
jgi:hypothetical protein